MRACQAAASPWSPERSENPIFLVVAGTDPLSGEEKFLLSVLQDVHGNTRGRR